MLRRAVALSVTIVALAAPVASAGGGKPCRRGCGDTAVPAVAVTSPAVGATVSGSVTATGTASDNAGVSAVDVSVDGGTWWRASGTTSWSLAFDSRSYTDGTHTLYARATDTSANVSTTSITLTFRNTTDTTAPAVAISTPSSGATLSGAANVAGSSSDNAAVSRVDVAVDGGAWHAATGTASWTYALATGAYANGTHTLAARATDTSGNVTTTSRSVTVQNTTADTTAPSVVISSPASGATVGGAVTVSGSASDNASVTRVDVSVDNGAWSVASGTTSWTYALGTTSYANGSHTVTARATDASGNTRTASVTVTVSNGTSGTQHWVSPEGVTIDIDSTGPWTVAQIYQMLKDNAAGPGDFARIAPTLTVKVQDVSGSSSSSSTSMANGMYTAFKATIYLQGNGGTFTTYPDSVVSHEYGHVWTWFHLYMDRQGDWSRYLSARWSNADGSLRLAGDSRVDSAYMWMKAEMIADDYRLLFGTPTAISQRNTHLNWQIVDPRQVTGLRNFFLTQWAG